MHLSSMLGMLTSGLSDRIVLGTAEREITGSDLSRLAAQGASTLTDRSALVYVGENHPLLPVALFAAAWAGVPFVPINYRLEDTQLNALVARQPGALVLTDRRTAPRVTDVVTVQVFDDWLAELAVTDACPDPAVDDDEVAVVLYTSGTTAEPKSALLRHRHLMAYLLDTVEFGGAGDAEAVLVCVPPYHVAGLANMLSNIFAGRRIVYLQAFDPVVWIETVRREGITNAMVVPTMLSQIVDAAATSESADLPTLRTLSYGGAKVSERVVRDALRLFSNVGFVNAYGLTETASTIAVLGPEAHRCAIESDDPAIIARLSSVGQVLPTIEVEVRDADGAVVPRCQSGIVHLRGEQISGEYASGSVLDEDGWFSTRDRGYLDDEDYLFIEGRDDDTIIRGGENIAPAEVEEVILSHPAVCDACVIGLPDDEWGQRLAAAVVVMPGTRIDGAELRSLVRSTLRGSKTPDTIVFRDSLPYTQTGKLLRRVVLQELSN